MKKLLFLLFLVSPLFASNNSELNKPYELTKGEWLQVRIDILGIPHDNPWTFLKLDENGNYYIYMDFRLKHNETLEQALKRINPYVYSVIGLKSSYEWAQDIPIKVKIYNQNEKLIHEKTH